MNETTEVLNKGVDRVLIVDLDQASKCPESIGCRSYTAVSEAKVSFLRKTIQQNFPAPICRRL